MLALGAAISGELASNKTEPNNMACDFLAGMLFLLFSVVKQFVSIVDSQQAVFQSQ
jgi:hypothetical protein